MRFLVPLFAAYLVLVQVGAQEAAQVLRYLQRDRKYNKLGKPFEVKGNATGYTGEECSNSSECAEGRKCVDVGICFPENEEDLRCNCSKFCPTGETCIITLRGGKTSSRVGSCVSTELFAHDTTSVEFVCEKSAAMPSPTPSSPSSTCIDANLLSEFAPHELVFNEHQEAYALCDRYGSCATGGHIVHYRGSAMMMTRYCDIVGCEKRLMRVNSPVRRRGLRIKSRSKDLKFTAFAARYETRTEEFLLSAAVHIGL